MPKIFNFFEKPIDIAVKIGYNSSISYGGIAQLARAFGSYPKCQWFESVQSHH